MDKGVLIKDLANELGVTEDTVINWEMRGKRPAKGNMQRVINLIPNIAEFF
jgi:DNA-binding transcriptional regulator YiaG